MTQSRAGAGASRSFRHDERVPAHFPWNGEEGGEGVTSHCVCGKKMKTLFSPDSRLSTPPSHPTQMDPVAPAAARRGSSRASSRSVWVPATRDGHHCRKS